MSRIGPGVLAAALAMACAPTVKYVDQVEGVNFPVKESLALTGKLYRPEGAGPFPAVVLMHGCAGVSGDNSLEVSDLLRDAGYVAFLVDSFSRRHVSNVCNDPDTKSPTSIERVEDAFAARRYLSSLAFVDSSRIGLLGWSHGGRTALLTWDRNSAVSGTAPFAAIAAYYPLCTGAPSSGVPLLILIGESDDWCPAEWCKALVDHATAVGIDASIMIYPGATHSFDGASTGTYLGHKLVRDAEAARDSRERLLAFFNRTMKQP